MAANTAARLAGARDFVKQDRLATAEVELRSILDQDPGNVAAQMLLSVTYFRMGSLAQAAETLCAVLRDQPALIDAIGFLAVIRKTQNDLPGAVELYQRLLTLGHQTVDVYNQLGACWLEIGDAVAAGGAFKRAIELDRTVAHSYYNLGMALKLAGRSFETFSTFKRSAELDPDFVDNYVQLWEQMRQLLNWRDGLPILENGLRRHPNSARLMVMVASTYGKVGRPHEAEALFKSAAELDPSSGPPYAHWLQEEGRFAESVPVLKRAIAGEPIQGQAYYNLAIAKCFEVDGKPMIELISSLLAEKSIGGEGRMFLYYALAKSFDQEKNFELAMHYYDLANEQAYQVYNAQFDHDTFAVEHEHAALLKLYSKESIEALQRCGSESEIPIFIVGMIRTGTTLLDQILSSHPQVKSAGEQPFWQVSAGRVNQRWMDSGGNSADIRDLETRYLEVIHAATGGAPRVIDKMPTNFIHMGLMSVVFPNAKFIHIRRSPLDTCLSIYTTFLGSGTQFAYNQGNIVAYYREYLRAMEHWRSVIPRVQICEIDYEDLVSKKEAVMRSVLNYCEIEWDDEVLQHERNSTQVSTPSLWAVRQPVNTDSVEKWRRYEPWLGRLLELKDVAHPRPLG